MKRWNDLTPDEQQAIREQEWSDYTSALLEIGPDFIGPSDHPVRERFEKLAAKMERMQTPWFLGEEAYHDPIVGAWIKEQVEDYLTQDGDNGEYVFFLEPGDIAIRIPIEKVGVK